MKLDKIQAQFLAAFIIGGFPRIFFARLLKRATGDGGIYAITKEELAEIIYETQRILSACIAGAVINSRDQADSIEAQVELLEETGYTNSEEFEKVYDQEYQNRIHIEEHPFSIEFEAFKLKTMDAKSSVSSALPGLIEFLTDHGGEIDLSGEEHDCDNCDAAGRCPIEPIIREKRKKK